jgi:hypothetical protein
MTSFLADEIADRHGGWAQLCDLQFNPPSSLYAEFEAVGLSATQFDVIRIEQRMPAKQRAILDSAEELLRAWARYLCGYEFGPKGVFSGRFTDLPVSSFWREHLNIFMRYQIEPEEVETFISAIKDAQTPIQISPYFENRAKHICELAHLCERPPDPGTPEEHKPPDSGGPDPDPDPSLVPRRPLPRSGGALIALALPEPEEGDKLF